MVGDLPSQWHGLMKFQPHNSSRAAPLQVSTNYLSRVFHESEMPFIFPLKSLYSSYFISIYSVINWLLGIYVKFGC